LLLSDQSLPDIPLPTGWAKNVKSAVLHVISLAQYAMVATRGWAVTAVDWSDVALDRGRRLAEHQAVTVEWVLADLREWEPPARAFNLVIVTYLQPPAEARALIENALGFCQAAQNKYTVAIRHYRAAIRAKGDYPVALNNLAFALDKQGKPEEARTTYQQVLNLDPANKTARRGLSGLDRRSGLSGKAA